MAQSLEVTWLGHAGFRFKTPGGKTILVDPWLDNPNYPESCRTFDRVDTILVTHGHFDHYGSTIELAKKYNAHVVGIFELYLHVVSKGIETATGMNKGGTMDAGGVKVTMVSADHSSGCQEGDTVVYCGDPVGYILTFENAYTVYHAGDTNVFSDMAILGRLYKPDVAILPIGGLYTMSPYEAAEAIRLLRVKTVVPMHYGTFPVLTGTPEQLESATANIEGLRIITMVPGEPMVFGPA